jgi:hypothetical protein
MERVHHVRLLYELSSYNHFNHASIEKKRRADHINGLFFFSKFSFLFFSFIFQMKNSNAILLGLDSKMTIPNSMIYHM